MNYRTLAPIISFAPGGADWLWGGLQTAQVPAGLPWAFPPQEPWAGPWHPCGFPTLPAHFHSPSIGTCAAPSPTGLGGRCCISAGWKRTSWAPPEAVSLMDTVEWRPANFFCKGPDSQCFRLCGPSGLCCYYSATLAQKQPKAKCKWWAWLCSLEAWLREIGNQLVWVTSPTLPASGWKLDRGLSTLISYFSDKRK